MSALLPLHTLYVFHYIYFSKVQSVRTLDNNKAELNYANNDIYVSARVPDSRKLDLEAYK